MGLLLRDSLLWRELPVYIAIKSPRYNVIIIHTHYLVVSSYKESCNNKPMYGYMLPNLSPSPNLYKVQSIYNNNVAS